MHLTIILIAFGLGLILIACATPADQSAGSSGKSAAPAAQPVVVPATEPSPTDKVVRADSDWCSLLTPEQYKILRGHGTEAPFQNLLWNNHQKGTYRCAGCGLLLFSSDTKFDSGTGWPSFYEAVSGANVKLVSDHSFGMERIEVLCPRCGGHLGHVFDDGPAPTGKRFCINSGALTFEPATAATLSGVSAVEQSKRK